MADAFDRLVAPDDLGPLEQMEMRELRERRNSLQEAELALSYVRRQVQVRLDIVVDECQHRAGGAAARDPAALVAELPKILAEHAAGASRGPFPEVAFPPEAVEAVVAELDSVFATGSIGDLESLSDQELAGIADELRGIERRVSVRRGALHVAIDALQEEMLRRYKSGEATVDALLQ